MTEPIARRRVPFVKAFLDYLVEMVLEILPHDGLSNRVKSMLLRWRGATIGSQLKLWRGVWIADNDLITNS